MNNEKNRENSFDINKPISKDLIRYFFDTIEAKDITAAMDGFNEGAEFIDPHYPNTHMKGKEEILSGLTWGFKGLKKLGFTIVNYYEAEDGQSAAVEVATAHELPNGKKLNFPQVFIFEVTDHKITRLQAYEPYGPHGHINIMLIVTRFINKLKAKL